MTTMVRKLRLQRGWTQEQLAELSGLSVRSIQRIERGQTCSLESQNALAAVFQVERSVLDRVAPANNPPLGAEEVAAIRDIKGRRDFLSHVFLYLLVVMAAGVVFGFERPSLLCGAIGWGIGVVAHGLAALEVLSLFDAGWEAREFEKRVGRSLGVAPARRGFNHSIYLEVRRIAMKLSAGMSSTAALAGIGLLAWVSYDAGSITNTLGLQPFVNEAAVALVSLSLGSFLVVFGMYSWRKARKAASAQMV